MVFSADHLSAKVISAVTAGYCEVIQQFITEPQTGSKADWMSAAVVPGAKLLPMTTNGPELAPLMLIPPPELSRIVDCPFVGLRAEIKRFSSGRRLFLDLEREAFEGAGGAADTAGLLFGFGFGFELVDAER